MAQLTMKLLGQSTIEIDGKVCKFRQKRSVALLIYCVLEQKLIDRDVLCDLLWSGYDTQTARKRLSDALSALKTDLEKNSPGIQISDYLTITPDSVQPIQDCSLDCDVLTFESLSRADISTNEALEKACELYGGSFLAAFGMRGVDQAWKHWQAEKQQTLEEQYLSLLRGLSIAYLHEEKYQQATPLLLQLQAKDEEDQPLYAFLMLCHYSNRDNQRVRRIYEQYTEMMESSFSSPPEMFIENLWTEINKGSSAKVEPQQLLTNAFDATQSFEDLDLKQNIQTFIAKPTPPSDIYRRIARRLKQQIGMIGTPHLFLILCQEDAELAATLLGRENLRQITQFINDRLRVQERYTDSTTIYTLALHNVMQRAEELMATSHVPGVEIIHLWRALLHFEDLLPVQAIEIHNINLFALSEKLDRMLFA